MIDHFLTALDEYIEAKAAVCMFRAISARDNVELCNLMGIALGKREVMRGVLTEITSNVNHRIDARFP